MIYINKIVIHDFRGIRDLTFEFKGENFAICGPNGTGKSGIVDAIEFALTGSISRLSGRGTGGLSVKEHGPHVDSRNKPDKAYVTLSILIISSGKQVTIHRTVKNARNPTITPDEAEVKTILDSIEQHPEFVLSRRELIRYILSEAGNRSKEVQALLKLDKLETLRSVLQKIDNSFEREKKPLEINKTNTREELTRALGITQLSVSELINEINKRRTILCLPDIKKLESDTSIKDGLITSGIAINSRVPKTQGLNDIKNVNTAIDYILSSEFQANRDSVLESIIELNLNVTDVEKLSKESLLKTALELFDENNCPICDTVWDPEEFRILINKKLKELATIQKKRADIEKKIEPLLVKINELCTLLRLVSQYGPLLSNPIDIQPISIYISNLSEISRKLISFIPLEGTLQALKSNIMPTEEVKTILAKINKSITEIPEPSQQDLAREYLVVGQGKLETYRKANQQLEACNARAIIAKNVYEKYVHILNQELEDIYKNVETTFSNLYRIINNDDESAFEAKLIPSMGKLGFDVDFYGRGFFPPGAYHSEGHQDGMGLCLYLALMEHLLGDNFSFAVLDDVLMSVDSGHRREVCTLLKQKFPNTQFILTTHDDVWLKHMKTAGLIKRDRFIQFRTWNVEVGPTEWSDRDVWREIRDHLEKNEIRLASGLLRHYLEYFSKEVCHRLKASVVFRGDAQFTLGDLLPPAITRLRKILKDGKKSAESWKHEEKVKEIEVILKEFEEKARKSEAEQWQINTAIHYNEWANLNRSDFSPMVEAFKDLVKLFECDQCNEVLYIIPEFGKKEAVRCGCGNVNINLIIK